jgi:hypothetical protein
MFDGFKGGRVREEVGNVNREENGDGNAPLPQLHRDRSPHPCYPLSTPPHRTTKIFSLATLKDDHIPVFLTTLYGPHNFKKTICPSVG